MKLYAAYAGNLDPVAMCQRVPNSPPIGTGWLRGWRLTFAGADLSWEGALPTVVEDPTHSVFVMLYSISEADLLYLDSVEGSSLGLYEKIHVRIATLDGEESAWLYVLRGFEGGFPRKRLLDEIISAAEAAGAPRDYIQELTQWQTEDD